MIALERSGSCHLTHTHTWNTPSHVPTDLLMSCFLEAYHLCYTFTGFNAVYGETFGKHYSYQDWMCAKVIRHFRCWSRQVVQLPRSEQLELFEMLYTIATS